MNSPTPARPRGAHLATLLLVAVAPACHRDLPAVFTQLIEARRVAADLRVQFNKASAASDRAVLADTDEAAILFARDADRLKEWVKNDVTELEGRLRDLGKKDELEILAAFERQFTEYDKVDHETLLLAVQSSNLKAQRLSFGPAREAADAFRDAIQAAASIAKDRCGAGVLVAKAVIAVREIQTLQAPHIAEAEDAAMDRMEKEMAARETTAREATRALAGLVDAKGRASVAAAGAALETFAGTSKELVALSRKNTDVRSLQLALRTKPTTTAACEDSLGALQEALAKEAFPATR